MAETSPTTAPEDQVHFDIEQLVSMAARIDKAAVGIVARLDGLERAAELEAAPDGFVGVDAEKLAPLEEHYAQLVTQFNNVLREAKREVPEPFILSIPEAPPDLGLRLLPAYAGQLAERLSSLARFSRSNYEQWVQFMRAVRAARVDKGPESILERRAGLMKKLANR